MIRIPTITLWNPWASWVARKLKRIETRTHNRLACLQGKWIAIHAGRFWHQDAFEIASAYLMGDEPFIAQQYRDECGHILCLAHVWGNGRLNETHSASALCDCSGGNLFGLIFDQIERLAEPVAAKGGRGIWWWTPESERHVRDITSPCGLYEPGDPSGDCQSDGHYMCKECVHLQPEEW
jgi:hypothetical protein